MPDTYKLTYFNLMGLAEPIRLLLAYGNISFVDERLELRSEEWTALKPSVPFGKIPVLEINGRQTHQSVAISRLVAKKVKLMGADEWENYEIDAMVDTLDDLRIPIAKYYMEQDPKKKEELRAPLFTETIPFYLGKIDAAAAKNGGYLCNKRLTWADVFFVGRLDFLNGLVKMDLLKKYENLQKVRKNVYAIPSIKKWTETRPKTDF